MFAWNENTKLSSGKARKAQGDVVRIIQRHLKDLKVKDVKVSPDDPARLQDSVKNLKEDSNAKNGVTVVAVKDLKAVSNLESGKHELLSKKEWWRHNQSSHSLCSHY